MSSRVATFKTSNFEDTLRLGQQLASALSRELGEAPLRVAVSGPLGCGKTALAKGLFSHFEIEADRVVSPTFTLINEYEDGYTHMDLYRLKDWEDMETLGLDEILENPRLAVIEWAARFDILERWGLEHLEVRIGFGPENDPMKPPTSIRKIVVKPHGPAYHSVIGALSD